ncbi:MAG: hypothetical protein K2Y10_00345 [Burkholderiaceae bacterium]|nr:hypothetical protein [Burkholderiaceae bacterium]MBY0454748.1 hypothetical protein [Burkholderiaceae bacterium]
MSTIIAQVPTAVMVDGERVVIQPGKPLPRMTNHDERALLQAGAATNTEDAAALEQAQQREVAQGNAEFEAQRQAVQEAQASTENPSTKPTAKTNGKAAAVAE